MRRLAATLAAMLLLTLCAAPAPAEGQRQPSAGQIVYVAAYQKVYTDWRGKDIELTTTLSIRNTDPYNPITIVDVKHFDGRGKLVKDYADIDIVLQPLCTQRFLAQRVPEDDDASGSSFLVVWKAAKPVNPPLVQTIMVSTIGQQGITFQCRGVPLDTSTK